MRSRLDTWRTAQFLAVLLAASAPRRAVVGPTTSGVLRSAELWEPPTAAARNATDACRKHSRTSHRGSLRPLQTETYSKSPYRARRKRQEESKTTKKKRRPQKSAAPKTVTLRISVAVRVAAVRHVAAPRAPPFGTPDAADGAARARVEGERLRHERVVLGAEAVRCGDFRRGRVEPRREARQTWSAFRRTGLELSMSRLLHFGSSSLHQ